MRTRLLQIRLQLTAPWPLLACCFIAALPLRVSAQGETQSVVPGVMVRVNNPVGSDTVVYQRSVTRSGKDSTAGTRTVVSRIVEGPDHAPQLTVEQRFPAGGGGEIVDTAIADLRTLRAVAHRSHQPTRTMRFDFTGSEATGMVSTVPAGTDSATGPQSVRQSLGGPIFDSNVIDLVVASLPLEPGFAVDLPFFIYERGGRVTMPVAVRDRAAVTFPKLGARDVWIVTVGVPGAPATIWVDAKTRAVLRVRYDITARGVSFTDDRITPIRG
jgi:hypothetical protein